MGRQLKPTEDRSLREIHGCPGESTPPPANDGKRRSRSFQRQETRSPPRSDWGPKRGFGNILSPALGPLPDFHKGRDEHTCTPPTNREQVATVNASGGWHVPATTTSTRGNTPAGMQSNVLASLSEKGCPATTKTPATQLSSAPNSSSSSALTVMTASKLSEGMMGDTIVGVSNGGAYTIGPLYSRTVQQERQKERRRRRRKGKVVVIPLFMLATLVYFIATMYINNCPGVGRGCTLRFLRRMSFQPLKENPLLGPTSSTLLSVGAVDAVLTSKGKAGWRLLTSLWLPAGLFHLLLLMFGMLSVGIRFEQDFGWLCATLVFLIPGIGGSLLTALLYTDVASAGASSGALLGVLGARLAEMATTNVSASPSKGRWRAAAWCAATMGGCVCAGVMPNVGNVAHLGGCLGGFLLALVFLVRPHLWRTPSLAYDPDDCLMSRKQSVWHWALWALALALLLAAYAGLAVALFTHTLHAAHSSCSTSVCHHLSCVPTRLWNCSYSNA